MPQQILQPFVAPKHCHEKSAHQKEKLHAEPVDERHRSTVEALASKVHHAVQDYAQEHGKPTQGIKIVVAFGFQQDRRF